MHASQAITSAAPGPLVAQTVATNPAGATKQPARHRPLTVISQSNWFASGSTELLPPAIDYLKAFAAAMKMAPGLTILITGHTNSRGDAAANQRLSQARADAVQSI